MMKRVAVLYGGLSHERDVSLSSGAACMQAAREAGYDAFLIDVGHDISQVLLKEKPDVAFNALHGTYGEDGAIQGVLEFMRIPYTHSGIRASAVAMHKPLTRDIASLHNVPIAEAQLVSVAADITIKPPYVLKPIADGSSVGITLIEGGDVPIIEKGEYLAESYVTGLELTCGVLNGDAMGIIEIRPRDGFYDYENKYTSGKTDYIMPANIPSDVAKTIEAASVTMHKQLGCRGVTRSDYRFDPLTNQLAFLEINTHPGMTATSLVPKMAQHNGMPFHELIATLIELARCDIV